MLKTLLVDLFGQAGLFVIPVVVLYAVYHFGRRTSDIAWLLAFTGSLFAVGGLGLLQAKRLTDEAPGNDWPDPMGVSYVIAALFVAAVVLNAKTFWKINRELLAERAGNESATRRSLRIDWSREGGDGRVSNETLAEVDAEIDAREDLPRLIKKMLPTLGLIGTVIGLAIAMNELGGALSKAVGGKEGGTDDLMLSMEGALQGMGGAFITTLLGAGFGMLLMVLLTRTRVMLTRLLAEAKCRLDEERSKPASDHKPPRPSKGYYRPDLN